MKLDMPKIVRMSKKSTKKQDGVWLSPRYSLTTWAKTPTFEPNTAPPANRLLELADTSLELWEMKPKKAKVQKAG
jgi:hypothetical protein